jgi:co-chaperonin GroES (HSP10)
MVRAYGEWVLVKADPRVKQTPGGLVLTEELTQIEKLMEGTGRILSIGGRARNIVSDIEPGDRVCYRGFLKDAHKVDKIEGCDVFIIHCKDLLMVIDDEIAMGAFS